MTQENRIERLALLEAARAGDRDRVVQLVQENGDDPSFLDYQDADGRTALHQAVSAAIGIDEPSDPHLSTARALLGAGADPTVIAADGHSCIHLLACCKSYAASEIARDILAEHPNLADLQVMNGSALTDQWTALHFACVRGHNAMVEVLFKAGCRTDILDANGKSAEDMCQGLYRRGTHRTFQRLEREREPDLNRRRPAADPDYTPDPIFSIPVDELDADDKEGLAMQLSDAVFSRRWERAKALLEAGADIDGYFAVYPAAAGRILSVGAELLDAKAVEFALEHGAQIGEPEEFTNAFHALYGIEPDNEGARERQEAVRAALLRAADANDLNLRNEDGETAVLLAAKNGWGVAAVSGLLEAGADPGLQDCRGRTAADYAAEHGQEEVVRALRAARSGPTEQRNPPAPAPDPAP